MTYFDYISPQFECKTNLKGEFEKSFLVTVFFENIPGSMEVTSFSMKQSLLIEFSPNNRIESFIIFIKNQMDPNNILVPK